MNPSRFLVLEISLTLSEFLVRMEGRLAIGRVRVKPVGYCYSATVGASHAVSVCMRPSRAPPHSPHYPQASLSPSQIVDCLW